MTISLTISDSQYAIVKAALCANQGYLSTLPNGSANPQSDDDFLKEWLSSQMTGQYAYRQGQQAQRTAMTSISVT